MPHVTRLRVVSATVAAGALTLGTLAIATAAQAGTTRRAIADTHPAWAVAAKRLSSKAVTSGTVNAKVYLAPSNEGALAQKVAAVSNPKSSDYRHFLTAAQRPPAVQPILGRSLVGAAVARLVRPVGDQGQRGQPGGRLHRGARLGGRGQQGIRRFLRHLPGPRRPGRTGA